MTHGKEIARPAGGTAERARMESARRADTIIFNYYTTKLLAYQENYCKLGPNAQILGGIRGMCI